MDGVLISLICSGAVVAIAGIICWTCLRFGKP